MLDLVGPPRPGRHQTADRRQAGLDEHHFFKPGGLLNCQACQVSLFSSAARAR
jgi:hypothetical protein